MTDDSTSRDTEDEESAEGERRPDDTEETPSGRGEETTPEPEGETTIDGELSLDDEPSADHVPSAGEEPSVDEDSSVDDDQSMTDDPTMNEDDSSMDDETPLDDSSQEQAIPGNPMAGIEAEPESEDTPDSQDDPASQPNSEHSDDSESVASPATPEDETVAVEDEPASPNDFIPDDVQKYERFKKMDGARYDRVNEFLRDRTYVTAREWAIARLCADFRTETGVEMTKIGENLPRLVPFMNDTYTPQAVNQARHSFEEKVRKSGATFLYGAMSGFFTAEQLDDVMYEITEVAKFLLEVEGVDLSVEEELEAEDRILSVMREVREQSEQLRHEGATCPECGHEIGAEGDD